MEKTTSGKGATKSPNKPEASAFRVDVEKIRLQIRRWQEKVLDLTKSNPLLGLNRSRVAKLPVTKPDSHDLFARLVIDENELRMPLVRKKPAPKNLDETGPTEMQEEQGIRIEPGDIEFDASALELMRRLRRIYDNARTTVEERGVTTLYMTFGALHWRDELFGESVSPLWMVPCELASKGPDAPLRLSIADEEMQLNPALEYCLRERHKIEMPALPDEPSTTSLKSYLAAASKAVQEQRWEITDEAWLSTFTFESLVIYQDLKAMVTNAAENQVVSALARAGVLSGQSEALPDDLDSVLQPESSSVPILPTDSSQLEALTYAAGGRNVVIHGPPGTGKSQTITNLIADALARNEKVLFVSAKMAALNVVYDRLKELGLERFCLEAHSTKAGKMKVIDALRRTLEAETGDQNGSLAEELRGLLRLRQELNGYVRDLHKRIEPLGLSVYQAIGKIAKLQRSPDIRASLPDSDPLAITRQTFDDCQDVLGQLRSMAQIFDGRANHPWRGFTSERIGLDAQEQIEAALRRVTESAQWVLSRLTVLSSFVADKQLSFEQLETLRDPLESLATVERLPHQWWTLSREQLSYSASVFENACKLASEFHGKEKQLGDCVALAFRQAAEFLLPIETTFRNWYNRCSPGYWRWRSNFKRNSKPGVKSDYYSIRSYYELARRLGEIEDWFGKYRERLNQEIGSVQVKNSQELGRVASQFRAAENLQKALGNIGVQAPSGCEKVSADIRAAASALSVATPFRNPALKNAIGILDAGWPKGLNGTVPPIQTPMPALIARAAELLSAMGKLREWVLLERLLRRCQTLGLGHFIDSLGSTSAASAPTAFERRFYTVWTNAALEKSEGLAEFNGPRRRDLIEKFRILDTKIRRLAIKKAQSVASQASSRIKSAQDNLGTASEVGILRYELQKKKRVKPLRKLFSEIPHVLQALKPCMLMSPISVSTYLKPGAISFDVVVFDEASQLPTAEAVPSVLRSKRVIVAGDSNQLPPTSFFEAALMTEEEDDRDDAVVPQEPLESLLDDCVAIVPVFQESFLRWHYRSRDERLIKFSNHYFYENRLLTFPSSVTNAEGRGVQLVYVEEGVWDRGRSRTNRMEARVVARLALEHFEKYPERSLGIVAMNTSQREAIEDAIQEELRARPNLYPFFDSDRHERVFVKSLENVQGDERDTMLISVGYGKDSNGGLSFNFGPINTDGGWRRLNVLVTRAKWETILVTSLRSEELSGVNPNNRGAVSLRNFIAFAEHQATLPSDEPALTEGETNDFEDAVREVLVERGLTTDAQVGASRYRIDLAVRDRRDPTRYLIGIECDGATYHGSRTARDRDILRQEVLHSMGWRLHRVWSTEWFHDRENAIDSILRSIEQAESAPIGRIVHVPSPAEAAELAVADDKLKPAQKNSEPSTASRRFSEGVPYRKYSSARRSRDYILESTQTRTLAASLEEIVSAEGPIHEDLLLERLKEIHGIERAGSNVQDNVRRAIQFATKDTIERRERHFVCQKGVPLKNFRIPANDVRRPLEYIPREELELAVLYIVEDQFGMMREQIPQVISRLFGIERLRGDSADGIRSAVDALVERGALRTSGPHVYIA